MAKKLTPMKAIRAYCLSCSAGSIYEIKKCPHVDCELFYYRYGKRPTPIKKNVKSRDTQRKLKQIGVSGGVDVPLKKIIPTEHEQNQQKGLECGSENGEGVLE